MVAETSLLRPGDPEWDGWVCRAPHDFYHRAAYHAFSERQGEGEACLVVHAEGDRFMAWPYLRRDIDQDHADATSVYGYSGPVGQGIDDSAFAQAAWSAFRAVWREQCLVSLFTRFHPLIGNASVAEGLHGEAMPTGGETVVPGRSVAIDTALDTDARRAQYPQPLRQDVKKSERLGLVVELDDNWSCFDDFKAQYRATMAKNDASDSYLFSDAYFAELRDALQGVAHMAVARVGEDVAGAMMFTVEGPFAAAHLTGTDPAFNKYSPLKCLIDRTAELARDLGAKQLHLGAGRGGHEDSLYSFKSRFSPVRQPFALGRWILDAAANAKLTEAAHGDATPDSGFFPAYRAPAETKPAENG